MSSNKPFSQACENNKEPILKVIANVFNRSMTVCEIGSGTGQHASYFSQKLPEVYWQPTDRIEYLAGISAWVTATGVENLAMPLALDVNDCPWPLVDIEAIFTANTLHIMSWPDVEVLFQRLGENLKPRADVCIYGPFNYQGAYTSDSNGRFDQWLKERDPDSGIRDQEAVEQLARSAAIQLIDDVTMPANNRLLILRKE